MSSKKDIKKKTQNGQKRKQLDCFVNPSASVAIVTLIIFKLLQNEKELLMTAELDEDLRHVAVLILTFDLCAAL